MSHQIYVGITEEAQRAAVIAGEPASAVQAYDLPQELVPRALDLGARVTPEGGVLLQWGCRQERDRGIVREWDASQKWRVLPRRPRDAGDALDAIVEVTAAHEAAEAEAERQRLARIAAREAEQAAARADLLARQTAWIEALERDPTPAIRADGSWRTDLLAGAPGAVYGDGHGLLQELRPRLAAIRAQVDARYEEQQARRAAEAREVERRLLAEYGTQSQRERHEAGVIPEQEVRDLAHRILLDPLGDDLPRRRRLEGTDLAEVCDCEFLGDDEGTTLEVESGESEPVTDQQWKALKTISARAEKIRGATVAVRKHTLSCDRCDGAVSALSARVEVEWAGRKLSREYDLG